jgi:outer membrane protein assembly factor BamD (BamD/ComL family)
LEYLKVQIQYKFPEWQAPALYQAALCHEALQEWPEAAKTYENLLGDYPNSEYAAKAKARLPVVRKKISG